jgi:Flp pilus assembly protein TadB
MSDDTGRDTPQSSQLLSCATYPSSSSRRRSSGAQYRRSDVSRRLDSMRADDAVSDGEASDGFDMPCTRFLITFAVTFIFVAFISAISNLPGLTVIASLGICAVIFDVARHFSE